MPWGKPSPKQHGSMLGRANGWLKPLPNPSQGVYSDGQSMQCGLVDHGPAHHYIISCKTDHQPRHFTSAHSRPAACWEGGVVVTMKCGGLLACRHTTSQVIAVVTSSLGPRSSGARRIACDDIRNPWRAAARACCYLLLARRQACWWLAGCCRPCRPHHHHININHSNTIQHHRITI